MGITWASSSIRRASTLVDIARRHPTSLCVWVDMENLREHIDERGVQALNARTEEAWRFALARARANATTNAADELTSDSDETLLLHVPFTTNVKLERITIAAGSCANGASACKMVKVFANKPAIGFEDAAKKKAAQVLTCDRFGGEFDMDKTAFDNVRVLTLYFESNVMETERTSVKGIEIWGRVVNGADVNQLKPC